MRLQQKFLKEFTRVLILNSISQKERLKLEERYKRTINLITQLNKEKTEESPSKKTPEISFDFIKSLERKEAPEIPEGNFDLDKIKRILMDRNVINIECPGEKRYLIINRNGKRIPIKVMLGKNDIEEIINYFSQESRIPRIGGIFKAIVEDMIITAIDSEFAGSKFIITKLRPETYI
jgi:hypothetical protein